MDPVPFTALAKLGPMILLRLVNPLGLMSDEFVRLVAPVKHVEFPWFNYS